MPAASARKSLKECSAYADGDESVAQGRQELRDVKRHAIMTRFIPNGNKFPEANSEFPEANYLERKNLTDQAPMAQNLFLTRIAHGKIDLTR
jgi:hypothetical protein